MRITITQWIHQVLENHISGGDVCVDATMGKGNDTLFLCQCTGKEGSVTAFDIQEKALEKTKERLLQNDAKARLIKDGHEHMGQYLEAETVQCMMFNLGYLPGGDHNLATKPDTTVKALEEGFRLLKKGGIMSICIYSGKDSGFEERDRVLEYLQALDEQKFFVIRQDFIQKTNNPPMPVFVMKLY